MFHGAQRVRVAISVLMNPATLTHTRIARLRSLGRQRKLLVVGGALTKNVLGVMGGAVFAARLSIWSGNGHDVAEAQNNNIPIQIQAAQSNRGAQRTTTREPARFNAAGAVIYNYSVSETCGAHRVISWACRWGDCVPGCRRFHADTAQLRGNCCAARLLGLLSEQAGNCSTERDC